jgi:hypothetical protein
LNKFLQVLRKGPKIEKTIYHFNLISIDFVMNLSSFDITALFRFAHIVRITGDNLNYGYGRRQGFVDIV